MYAYAEIFSCTRPTSVIKHAPPNKGNQDQIEWKENCELLLNLALFFHLYSEFFLPSLIPFEWEILDFFLLTSEYWTFFDYMILNTHIKVPFWAWLFFVFPEVSFIILRFHWRIAANSIDIFIEWLVLWKHLRCHVWLEPAFNFLLYSRFGMFMVHQMNKL